MSKTSTVGEVIREARKAAGLSQAELAQRVGYANQSSISYLEAGEAGVSVETAVKIAEACQIPAEQLLAELGRASGRVPL